MVKKMASESNYSDQIVMNGFIIYYNVIKIT